MGKGGSQKQEVNEYHMSIHMGLCTELDALTAIYVGEKEAWSGNQSSEGGIYINRPDLFGGPKKEGGVAGTAYYLPGGPNQKLPDGLAARRGLTSDTHPAYRGLASLYFVGTRYSVGYSNSISGMIYDFYSGRLKAVDALTPGVGFMWGATPYMQTIWMKGRRAPKGLNPNYAMISEPFSVSLGTSTLTVDGSTIGLVHGTVQTVNGHSVVTSNSRRTTSIDGTSITITDGYTDINGKDRAGATVNIDGSTVNLPSGNTTASINGVSIELTGSYTYNPGSGAIKVFTFSVDIGKTGVDANPAHIIYECLTNTTWGMGANDTIINRESFEQCAITLFNEGFGISLLWTRETALEAFIGEVLDHIQGMVYVDPATGKITLKLLRDDYNFDSLPIVTPDNADLDNFQRKLWGETVNEIVVTWTNPTNEQEETVIAQDLAGITNQGGVVSSSRNYHGIRNARLATRVANRDVRQSSAPLVSVEAKLDRTQWQLVPGSVVRLSWPEYEVEDLVMRVMQIDYGKIGTPEITVNLMEDIFSLDKARYTDPPATGWVDPSQIPVAMDHVRITTAPAFFTSQRLAASEAAGITYPDVYVNVLGGTNQTDASYYELIGRTVLPSGETVGEEIGTRSLIPYGQLAEPLTEEAESLVEAFPAVVGGIPTVSGFVFIGDTIEQVQEIALIESFSDDGWVLRRGVLDTVPRAWPTGTSLWFYDLRTEFFDPDMRSDGESVSYKLLPMTSLGRLSFADAPIQGAMLTGRPHLPNRPANVTVGGVSFGGVDLSASLPSSVAVTWANRNRTMEDVTVLKWTDGTQPLEVGQTTTVTVVSKAGVVLATHSGLTGTSFSLPAASFGSEFEADVRISSSREGLDSLQYASVRVRIRNSGWGDDYGNIYGGPGAGYTPPAVGKPADPDSTDPYVPPPTFPEPW